MRILRPERLSQHVSFMLSVSRQNVFPAIVRLFTNSRATSHSQTIDDNSSSSGSDSSGSESDHQTRGSYGEEDLAIKERILQASLQFVPQYGWSQKALSSGAEAVGLPQVAHGMFPREGAELIHFFFITSNKKLSDIMTEELTKAKDEGLEKPHIRPFIEKSIETRLRMIIPYMDHWPKAMAIRALPQNVTESLSDLANLMDEIWFLAGDKSVDFNWYTKRLSLAGVYKSTEIFMIQDRSEDYMKTWSYLSRRLDNFETFGKSLYQIENSGSVLYDAALGMYIMGRNILGMNRIQR